MYVTDTHALLWYLNGNHRFLSPKTISVFDEAQKGNSAIYVPSIVLLEIAMLNAKSRIKLNEPFERWADKLRKLNGLSVFELNNSIIAQSVGYSFNDDILDKVIVATAVELDVPLITKDAAIMGSNLVEVFW
ncbi:MAG TPA: type II toxin-antitoxin system VapC family toxin [Pyrinomonadaceae bacterium]|nr:type II toxin-antitoxin system VapC family toxin [Pyrinomonadaceae bacterium]HMP64961.1 type II toxin-antitoxin system VapC family toxin [Pyrinomonadaceae bacterium]